jgi:ElaB/YqjD/DUF883 family membrane-anchored ribosome-binding protein
VFTAGDNLKEVLQEVTGVSKKKANALERKSKKCIKSLYRRMNEFKKGYKSKSDKIKDESSDSLQISTLY